MCVFAYLSKWFLCSTVCVCVSHIIAIKYCEPEMSIKYCYSRHLDTLLYSLLVLITGILGAVTVGQLYLILVSNFVVLGYCVLVKKGLERLGENHWIWCFKHVWEPYVQYVLSLKSGVFCCSACEGHALKCHTCMASNEDECNRQGSSPCPQHTDVCSTITGPSE